MDESRASEDVPALIAAVRRLRAALSHYAEQYNWQVWPQDNYNYTAFVSWCPLIDNHDKDPWMIAQDALEPEP